MTTIQITTSKGKRTVDATVFGPLAIHHWLNVAWKVTHVPSGLLLTEATTREQAIAIVGALLTLGIDWAQKLPAPLPGQREAVHAALAAVREVVK